MELTLNKIRLACGELQFKFVNNLAGDPAGLMDEAPVLKISELTESVEESGVGGVMLVSQMDVEMYDRANFLKNGIFGSGVTYCYLKVTLFSPAGSSNEYPVMYGVVDLSTISYPSYYDDGSGVEYHSAKFTVFSILKNLELTPTTDLITALDALTPVTFGIYKLLPYTGIINEIQKLIFSGISTEDAEYETDYASLDVVGPTSSGDTGNFGPYLIYRTHVGGDWPYAQLFRFSDSPYNTAPGIGSYMNIPDCKSLLMQMAGDFLLYPLLVWDLDTDKVHFKFRQRGIVGVNPNNLGRLIESTLDTFKGYDAIRCAMSSDSFYGVLNDEAVSDVYGLTNAAFGVLAQKFDYKSYVRSVRNGNAADADERTMLGWEPYLEQWLWVSGIISPSIWPVSPNDSGRIGWPAILKTGMVKYFQNPAMYERKYDGVGIVSDAVQLLDRIPIGQIQVNYTVTEIVRDFVEDTKTIKMVGL